MPKPTDPAPNQQGRPRDKNLDDALIRATLQLLTETGMDGVTMAKIQRLSGIPLTSIYRRYPDAFSLISAAISADLAKVHIVLEDHGSLRADLLAFLRVFAETLNADRARMIGGMILPMQRDPKLWDLFREKLETIRVDVWRGIIARAVEKGTLRPEALDVQPLDDIAPVMIFYQAVVKFQPADDVFVEHLLDNVLIPALDRFRIA